MYGHPYTWWTKYGHKISVTIVAIDYFSPIHQSQGMQADNLLPYLEEIQTKF